VLLQGERIVLRPPDRGDIDLFLRWFNDPEIWSFLLRDRPLGRAEEEEWFANLHKRPEDVLFVIALKDGPAIGSCGLHKVGLPGARAELGIAIGDKEQWNRGLGGEAMDLLCEYGFQVLNLHRLGLDVYAYNARAIRCYERAGFQIEGRRREARFWNGAWHDVVQMGLLAREWRERRAADSVREFCRRDG